MDINVNKLKHISFSVLTAGLLTTGTVMVPTVAQADMFSTDKFSLYGDFRLRFEADWDSHGTTGALRSDRNRARIRARVGFNYKPNDMLTYGARLRSGSDNNHVSPHITIVDFHGNDTGSAQFNLDKWFLKAKANGAWAWVGRNSLPFWKQNEMFWDDDATPAGIAAGYKVGMGATNLSINAGYLTLPAGMQGFTGNMGTGQLVLSTKAGANKFTVAGGVLAIEANADVDGDAWVGHWDSNEARDYTIWVGSLQGKLAAGGLPLTVGLDWMHNAKEYGAADPIQFTRDHRDDTDGYVVSVKLGSLKNKGDWLLGYYYSHIETFAVHSSLAQDDWGRWNPQASNMEGHELRGAYKAMDNLKVVARFYSIEEITARSAGDSLQDGNRFRLDFNFSF